MAILGFVIAAIEAVGGAFEVGDKMKSIFKKSMTFEKLLGKSLTKEVEERNEDLKKIFNSNFVQTDEAELLCSTHKCNTTV
jgi:hypothetical protein